MVKWPAEDEKSEQAVLVDSHMEKNPAGKSGWKWVWTVSITFIPWQYMEYMYILLKYISSLRGSYAGN